MLTVLIVGLFLWYRRQRTRSRQDPIEAIEVFEGQLPHVYVQQGVHSSNAKTWTSSNAASNLSQTSSGKSTTWDQGEFIPAPNVRLIRTLGRGSYGEVLLGKYAGAYVAVKKLHAWSSEAAEQDFFREVELCKSLHHPNIVQFLGVVLFPEMGVCSLCEFMERGDLFNVLQNPALELSWKMQKQRITIDTISGLLYLHSFAPPIIHRDLKSRNILIGQAFNAKLADFGLSRPIEAATMTVAGSNLWLAPEMIRGERYTEKADIFSFGILLSELDTRRLPYHDCVDANGAPLIGVTIAHRVAFEHLRPSLSPNCPELIRTIFVQCTVPQPHRRPSADHLLRVLENGFIAQGYRKSKSTSNMDDSP